MTARWVPPDRRDEVVDCVTSLSTRTELPVRRLLQRLGIARAKYARWTASYGAVPTPHGPVPRDHWLTQAERDGILCAQAQHPLDGYRALTYRMLEAGDVAVSPTSVYRVLKAAGCLDRWTRTPSKKGTGFDQPTQAHAHWHIDFTYINIAGAFYYLSAILDGWSRFLVHWELRESMTTHDVTTILQRAREQFPDARPRMISDNGPQCIARDFREFVRLAGMTHVRTAPYYPQSHGKLERGIKPSKSPPFARRRRPRSTRRAAMSPPSSRSTTRSAYTVPSAPSRPLIASPVAPRTSGRHGMRDSKRRARPANSRIAPSPNLTTATHGVTIPLYVHPPVTFTLNQDRCRQSGPRAHAE